MAEITICSDFGAQKIKSATISPSISHEVMGPDAMIFVFWMSSFKPAISLSSFTFIKGFFLFAFFHKGGVICISEVIDISPCNLDSSLCFILPGILYDILSAAKSLQSCLTLCDPRDGSPPGSPIPGILQARTLEWVAISFSSAWKGKVKVKLLSHVLQWPHGLEPTGSSIHGIFQERVLEWGAIAFSLYSLHRS